MNNKQRTISLDTLLLFILTLATIDQVPDNLSFWKGTFSGINIILPFKPELMVFGDPIKPLYNVFKVCMLIGYMFIDLLCISKKKWQETLHNIKLIIISSVVSLTVIIPTANWIAARHSMGPSSYAHDGGVVQTEEAMKFMSKGENPYFVTYENTPVKNAVNPVLWEKYGLRENPIIHHFPYPPFTFLFFMPFFKVSTAILGWYDQRFVYLILFVLTLILAYKIAEDYVSKLSIVMALSLNPFSVPGIKEGMNDIFLLFWITVMIYMLKNKKTTTAALSLALACGSKQMAWVMVPFFLAYLHGTQRDSGKTRIKDFTASRELAVFAITILIIFIPFLTWNAHAFISDILSFHSGTTAHPYPLRGDAGYGFANIVLHFGLISSLTSYFPFTLFQVIFIMPLLGWFLFIQVKENSVNQMLTGYTMTLFAFLFFGRYFAANYIGFILSLLSISYFMQEREVS